MLRRYLEPDKLEAGCDEAGRGCLAGPVCAAAVIMPSDYTNPILNDSKKMTALNRERMRAEIEKNAIAFGVAFIGNTEIDEMNILRASIAGMHKALDALKQKPDLILVDGNKFYQYRDIRHRCVIKGDGQFISIAAASVLAKTYRDELMMALHNDFKEYGWARNKGYPTKAHREAILHFGISKFHRRSYKLTDTQKEIVFY